MTRKKLALLVAGALAAGHAMALERSVDGVGQAVLLPYYTAHGGRSTLFSVSNHTDDAKAVRVVLAEGYNGRPALTFNVYLAPRDSWSGAVVASSSTEATPPRLHTSDASCTTGDFPPEGAQLREDAYTGSRDDGLVDDPLRLHVGQIEILEMGRLSGTAAQLAVAGDCTALRNRFAAGQAWAVDVNADVAAPSGGLSADEHIIDVASGIGFDVPGVAFSGFSGAARHGGASIDFNATRIHKPTLATGQAEFVSGGIARFAADRGADAVSYLFMAERIEGSFMLNESVEAGTLWAVSFPTRAAYLDNRTGGEFTGPARPPFAGGTLTSQMSFSCIGGSATIIDKGGKLGDVAMPSFCSQVEERGFFKADDMADPLFDPVPGSFATGAVDQGRLRIDFDPSHALAYKVANDITTASISGLPVVAYALMESRNKAAQPGLLATYAITDAVRRIK